ncbi:hypothetical protein KC19_2G167400 [Ceratodon purpureus]|uniref:Protein kinase domain-containing protein n=1 Tax=Ceratodon purpureus TaxID=3225 RepID=A0A8T0IX27_CERPU|nr:hypothetical protein KC19_2G167400 [Ceratodon purpureus]
MAECGLGFGCTMAKFIITTALLTRVAHAGSASGYCPVRTCGTNADASIRFPFRLLDDALSGRCYSSYPALMFQCMDGTLYLNFTGSVTHSSDMYKVSKIDYWNQTLSLAPHGYPAICRPFDASRFGGLNITNTTTLLLDCATDITGQCTKISGSSFSNACNNTGGGVNTEIGDRWSCPMTLKNYKDAAFSACYLVETPQAIPNGLVSASSVLELQFAGNRTLSLTNFTSVPLQSPGPAPTTTTESSDSARAKKKRLYIILGVVFGFLAAIIIFLVCMIRRGLFRHSPSRKTESFRGKNIEAIRKLRDFKSSHILKNHSKTFLYTLKELQEGTKNFSDDCKLGSGGFGTVYKGTLDDGVEVAIKKTNRTVDMKGISEQFTNEVILLSQVNHCNLVRLHGCCLEVEVPMLVYEYVSNGDLYQHLQGERPGIHLSWEKRLQIAIDTAEALRYLHSFADPPIYHRDMKTSNILLDDKFNVKVADFGISRLVKYGATHVSTVVQGTPGYLDPEYYRNFQFCDKSDVYSFGMVLLELVTSLKPVDFQRGGENVNLMTMALPFIQKGDVKAISDSRLFDESACESYDILVDQMQRVAELASKCLADSRYHRPAMNEVVAELVAIRGFENRAGQDNSNEISGMDHEGMENIMVPMFDFINFTSSSDSSYTLRSSKTHLASGGEN